MPSGCVLATSLYWYGALYSYSASYIRIGDSVHISAWASTLYWRCISVVHWKTIFLICYLLDYQQVQENSNVSVILLGDKKEPTKWKTNLVQQILLPNNHFPCYFYFKNHFYWRKERERQPNTTHGMVGLSLRNSFSSSNPLVYIS